MRPALAVACLVMTVCGLAAQEGVRIADLKRIVLPAEPHRFEQRCADVLKARLAEHYGVALEIVTEAPGQAGTVYVGRAPALDLPRGGKG